IQPSGPAFKNIGRAASVLNSKCSTLPFGDILPIPLVRLPVNQMVSPSASRPIPCGATLTGFAEFVASMLTSILATTLQSSSSSTTIQANSHDTQSLLCLSISNPCGPLPLGI